MALWQTTKRLLNTPQTTLAANPWQSSVIWGNGVVNNGVTVKAPTSVSNPSSLNPSTTTPPKTTGQTTAPVFSDNMTKPILAPVVTAPVSTTPPVQPISTPTPVTAPTPTVAPATPALTGVDKVNAETLARIEAEKKAQLIPPTTTEVPDSSTWMAIDDPNNFQMTGYTKEEFAALPDDLQQKALAQGKKNYENLQSTTDQLNYTNEVNARIANDTAQTEINKQTTALNNENANMLRNQAMREEEKSVRDLAQNIWFLGSGGRPVQSTWMLHAYADAINESNTKLNEIKMIQENQKTMEKLGIEFDANAYTERIRQLNQDLKSKTTQVFQDAINNYTQAERTWMVDSPAKMLKLQQQILMSTDISVSWFVQANLDKIAKLNDNITSHIEAVKKEAEKAEVLRKEKVDADIEFKKNANTVNEKMSTQTGYLTDGNGTIIRNSDTGAAIRYNPLAGEKPTIADGMVFEPIFNPETGETTYKKTRLYTPASEQGSWSLKELADGTIVKMNDKTGEVSPYNTSEGDPNGNDPASNPTTLNISNPQTLNQIIDFCTTKRGTDSVQCGMLVNDYIMKVTGQNPSGANRFQDSLQSKITAIDNIGRANWPVAGGLFAYPTNDPAGHTGIVTKVNADGSIEVLEANVKGSAAGWPPKVSTYPASKYKSWTFSQAPAGQKEAEAGVNTAGDAVKNIPWVAPVSKEDQKMQVLGLTQGLWGTEWERAMFANNILKKAQADWITLAEAKKKLGYKSGDDVEFAKARKEQFTNIAKNNEAITKGKSALTLLAAPQTAVGDVATVVGFLKTIDPSSVARESEVESVENARGLLDSLSTKLEKLKSGKKLSTEQRQELKDTIWIIVNAYENNMRDFISSSSQEFNDRGLDMSVYVPKDTINKYSGGSKTTTSNNPYSQFKKRP